VSSPAQRMNQSVVLIFGHEAVASVYGPFV